MSNVVYGGDLMLFIGSGTTKQPLAYSTTAKLSVSAKTRETASKDDTGKFAKKAIGKYDWNCSTDGLLSWETTTGTNYMDDVYALFLAGEEINIVFGSKTGTTPAWTVDATAKSFTGKGLITAVDLNASDGDNATYSITIEGNGLLSLV